MTLRRRLVTHLTLLIACLGVTAGVGLWGVNGLNENYGVALRGYEEQRRLYEIAFQLSTARLLLAIDLPDVERAKIEAAKAVSLLETRPGDGGTSAEDEALRESVLASIARMGERRPDARLLNVPLGRLRQRIMAIRGDIEAVESAARAKRERTLLFTGLAAAVSGLGAILLSVRGYRSVIRPLTRLGAGVHRVASGHFDEQIDPAGAPREFAALSDDFNRMARELQASYRDLHQRVDARTRQLVRSERLAGVGFLAAGVAHEINNPLGIITGYAELWLADPAGEDAARTITIARDEAYRCKQIVDRLLALARSPQGVLEPVRLDHAAAEVASLLGGLPNVRKRAIRVSAEDPACVVRADPGEIKQLLLNLCINALEAVGDSAGEVSIEVCRAGQRVDVCVSDTGRGMTSAQLARVFEPFYTDRAAGHERGLGLGLAISDAIVQSHGGTSAAHSAGPGKGSRFVVTLPADGSAGS